jgi:hypothetical protein
MPGLQARIGTADPEDRRLLALGQFSIAFVVLFEGGILEFHIPGEQFIDHFLPLPLGYGIPVSIPILK